MQKGISFVGLMDLGTLEALKVSAAKAASQHKEESEGVERVTSESKEDVAAATTFRVKEQVITDPPALLSPMQAIRSGSTIAT